MATSSIGATGRDYVDIPAFIASLPATLLEQEIGELYNDSEFTSTSGITISGITTTSSFNIVLRAATGEAFNDTEQALRYNASNGVAIRKTSSYGIALSVTVEHTVLEDLQIGTTGTTNAITLMFSGSTDSAVIRNCLIESSSNSWALAASSNASYINCDIVVSDGASSGTDGVRISYATPSFLNCTVFSNYPSSSGFGFEKIGGSSNGAIVKNCAIFGFGTAMESGTWGSGTDFNATDDSSLPAGSNNQTSLTTASQFENVASEATLDLRAVASGSLQNGTPDIGNTGGVDIFGNARDATTPYIGCYEVSGTPPSTSIPVFMQHLRNQGMI